MPCLAIPELYVVQRGKIMPIMVGTFSCQQKISVFALPKVYPDPSTGYCVSIS